MAGGLLLIAFTLAPVLAAEVAFPAWTDDRKLRHASFKGVRDDADAGEIFEVESA